MFIEVMPVGVFRCNCIIIACDETREAIVIDPGDEPKRIVHVIRRNGLSVRSIILTHAHLDHIMGTFGLVEATGAIVRLHGADLALWNDIDNIAAAYHIPTPRLPALDAPLMDCEFIYFGSITAQVIHTPGHTLGSCCFHVLREMEADLLLTGDTLFRGKIGFPGPPRRSAKTVVASIQSRILGLPDDTRVIPGHGPTTEIGIERRHNPFLVSLPSSPGSRTQ